MKRSGYVSTNAPLTKARRPLAQGTPTSVRSGQPADVFQNSQWETPQKTPQTGVRTSSFKKTLSRGAEDRLVAPTAGTVVDARSRPSLSPDRSFEIFRANTSPYGGGTSFSGNGSFRGGSVSSDASGSSAASASGVRRKRKTREVKSRFMEAAKKKSARASQKEGVSSRKSNKGKQPVRSRRGTSPPTGGLGKPRARHMLGVADARTRRKEGDGREGSRADTRAALARIASNARGAGAASKGARSKEAVARHRSVRPSSRARPQGRAAAGRGSEAGSPSASQSGRHVSPSRPSRAGSRRPTTRASLLRDPSLSHSLSRESVSPDSSRDHARPSARRKPAWGGGGARKTKEAAGRGPSTRRSPSRDVSVRRSESRDASRQASMQRGIPTSKAQAQRKTGGGTALVALQARLLQWCFLNAKAASAFQSQQSHAQSSMQGAVDAIKQMREEAAAVQSEVARRKHELKLDAFLDEQGAALAAVDEALPQLEECEERVSGAIRNTTHHMPVTAVDMDPARLVPALQRAAASLSALNHDIGDDAEEVRKFTDALRDVGQRVEVETEHVKTTAERLRALSALENRERSLRISAKQMA